MATYEIKTTGGTYRIETQDGPAASPTPSATSYGPVSDFMAGVGAQAAHVMDNVYQLLRKAPGLQSLPKDALEELFGPNTHYDLAHPSGGIDASVPHTLPAQAGRLAGQVAEYAIPASRLGEAMASAPALLRILAQGGLGGALSGIDTQGDPSAMATGAALGAGGEALAQGLGALAPHLYNARFPRAVSIGDREAAQALGFQNGVPLTRSGLKTLGDVRTPGTLIGDLSQRVQDALAAPHAVVGNASNQLTRMSTIMEPFTEEIQASRASNMKSSGDYRKAMQEEIQPQLDQWAKRPPTVAEAQELKKRLYKEIADSQWSDTNGSVTPPAKLAKELLARGLKNAVNERIPEVAGLNNQLHSAITLQDAISDEVKRNPSRLHDIATIAGLSSVGPELLTGHPGWAASTLIGMVGHRALVDPGVASRLSLLFKDSPRITTTLAALRGASTALLGSPANGTDYSTLGARSDPSQNGNYIPPSLPLR